MRILAADVGGTKTLVSLYEGEPGAFREIAARRYDSRRFAGLSPIVADFLGEAARTLDAAAIGVAGPVIEDTCRATNLPWQLDARAIARDLGVGRVRLLNDFEAIALGVDELPDDALEVLQDRPAVAGAPKAILGAGTGLGEAILLPAPDGGLPRVLATEGGHTDFAPRDETEIALLRFLLRRHAHVSYERILSGPGIEALYEFVVAHGLAEERPEHARRLANAEDRAAEIGAAALSGSDPASVRAISMFASIYGAEAGNLALKTLPFGGVYVAGGIAAKLAPLLRSGELVRAFRDKGRMEPVLDRIRVSLVLEPRVGLLGARRVAAWLAGSVTSRRAGAPTRGAGDR
ncbi:MAG TPA: glucokinase [Sandaracinaceae bacterium]